MCWPRLPGSIEISCAVVSRFFGRNELENWKVNSEEIFQNCRGLAAAPAFGGGAGYPPRRTDARCSGKWQVVAADHRVSTPAAKNLRVKVDSGSVRVAGRFAADHQLFHQQSFLCLSEEKARREFEAYKISVYLRGDTAWVVGEWQGSRPRRSSSEFVINVPRNADLVKVATDGGDLVATGIAGRVEAESGGGSIHLDDIGAGSTPKPAAAASTSARSGGDLTVAPAAAASR